MLKKKYFASFLLLLLLLMLQACNNRPELTTPQQGEKTGYRPIYISKKEAHNIKVVDAQPLQKPGKIYVYQNYLFVNELGKGIHIIDNTDPSSPINKVFINIPGNVDIAVKGNVLYADNIDDLLTFNINDLNNIVLKNRIESTFKTYNYPFQSGYFECVNPEKGIVIGWEKATLENPQCRR